MTARFNAGDEVILSRCGRGHCANPTVPYFISGSRATVIKVFRTMATVDSADGVRYVALAELRPYREEWPGAAGDGNERAIVDAENRRIRNAGERHA